MLTYAARILEVEMLNQGGTGGNGEILNKRKTVTLKEEGDPQGRGEPKGRACEKPYGNLLSSNPIKSLIGERVEHL